MKEGKRKMAFMGRGDSPSIEREDNDTDREHGNWFRNYRYYGRFYQYIPLDNTYVIMQMIATFIILIVGGLTFLITYKSTIIDPIESTKNLFINAHLITIGVLLGLMLAVNFVSKNASTIVKRIVIVCLVSILSLVVFFGIKINLDTTYTRNRFEQFYIETNGNETSEKKTKVDIGLTGVSLKTEKEYYVDECMKLYSIFQTKTYGMFAIHLLLSILLIYQAIKVSKIENKKNKLSKDDLILYDEEENVKI